jgi:formylglycine-generating enzyme required for sulfatase activity
VQLAQDMTRPPEVVHVRNGKAIGSSSKGAPFLALSQPDLLACARAVLKHINAYVPPTEAQWAVEHPQVGFARRPTSQ